MRGALDIYIYDWKTCYRRGYYFLIVDSYFTYFLTWTISIMIIIMILPPILISSWNDRGNNNSFIGKNSIFFVRFLFLIDSMNKILILIFRFVYTGGDF